MTRASVCSREAVTLPVRECPGVVPGPDGTCKNCGNRVGEYYRAAIGRRRWEHRRGSVPGSENARHGSLAASKKRVANRAADRARIEQLEAALELEQSFHERDVMARLGMIEAKLDTLLSRPGSWQPNHRRIADGGEPVRKQRRRAKRTAEAPPPAAPDWRLQRLERPKVPA